VQILLLHFLKRDYLEPASKGESHREAAGMASVDAAFIRPARQDELSSLLDMRHAMILELDDTDLDNTRPEWRARFGRFVNELADDDKMTFFVAELDGNLIGMGGVYQLRNHSSEIYGRPSAYVTSVYVFPEHRRNGIARRITQSAIQWAREHGCVVVRLRASDIGRRVYETLGFTPTEEMELTLEG
jgi:GNAT superfamily N-acetyltransferase